MRRMFHLDVLWPFVIVKKEKEKEKEKEKQKEREGKVQEEEEERGGGGRGGREERFLQILPDHRS